MNATTIAQAATIAAADVVWGRPVKGGKTLARRKGIVLGQFADDSKWLVIWWYGMGDASMDTTTLMHVDELVKAGDIFDTFRGRKAASLARGCYHFTRARSVGRSLESHGRRMKSIGVL